jgi:prophage regulatory protein
VLDLLRIDGGQLTIAELLGQRALAAAEIAKLRTQIESLTNSAAARPNPTPPGAKKGRRTAVPATVHSMQAVATNCTEAFPPNALIRLTDVCRLVGLSRSTIYRRVSDGTFPRPLRVSVRSVRWRMHHILDWSATLAE